VLLKLICLCGPLQVEDQYGSPSLDEVSIFSREFYSFLESKIGEQAAGKLSVEVSSPVGLPFYCFCLVTSILHSQMYRSMHVKIDLGDGAASAGVMKGSNRSLDVNV